MIHINILNIDLKKFLKKALPTIWKIKPIYENDNLQWLVSLIKPIRELKQLEFEPFRDNAYFIAGHSGQVYSLEHYLNNYFNLPFPTQKPNSIYIVDTLKHKHLYLLQDYEWDTNLNDEPVYIETDNESSTTVYDLHTINSPNGNVNDFWNKGINSLTGAIFYQSTTGAGTKTIELTNGAWVIDSTEYGYGKTPNEVTQWYEYTNTGPTPTNTRATNKYYLYKEDEYLQFNESFTVYCPTLPFVYDPQFKSKVRAIIDRYKPAGFTYNIKFY